MARSSWKYHFFKLNELEQYVNYLTDNEVVSTTVPKRKTTLHKFNYFIPQTLHTGKWLVDKYFSKYHIGFKLGQFTKNRKPYYFRSKKKKNVTKEYILPW